MIGDLHGKDVWEKIPDLLSFDRVIFLGDYFDSKTGISEKMQISNFLKILKLKETYPEKFVLLVGNHDYHYLPISETQFSGFSESLFFLISEILKTEYINGLLDAVFQFDHFLISHAGVTKTWFAEKVGNHEGLKLAQIAETISSKWRTSPESFDFDIREGALPDGDNVFQSPFITRPNSLVQDSIPNCIQIVGHTQVKKIKWVGNNLVMCDTFGFTKEVVIIRDMKIEVLEF